MLALFILIVFGLGTAYFATQNTGNVAVTLVGYQVHGLPLYTVVIVSILFGVLVSWLISLVDSLSSGLTIHSKDSQLQKSEKAIQQLQEKIRELEIENARLLGEVKFSEHVTQPEKEQSASLKPSFFHRVQQSLG